MAYSDFKNKIILSTEASNEALKAVLTQKIDGIERTIIYLSQSLIRAEKNYWAYEKEILAKVFRLKKFKPYIYGQRMIVKNDYKPLKLLLKEGNTQPNERFARWIMTLQDFDVKI